MLEKYNKIWNNFKNLFKKELMVSQFIMNDKYIITKSLFNNEPLYNDIY